MRFLDRAIKEYLAELSARKIVPGGGSAAALTAALGAGLNLMVINYTIKPDLRISKRDRIKLLQVKRRQEKSLKHLALLIDKDCRVFQRLMAAYASKRSLEAKYIAAARVPLEVCREASVSMGITKYLAKKANKNLISDVGCAMHMLKAAFDSARLNVNVNLEKIKDAAFVRDTKETLAGLLYGYGKSN